ncbi:hypothetical protein N7454_003660 [Penicillium verhagenii]|nr:hypothetical protein N7454_003660 [Penicillium verhagenii]
MWPCDSENCGNTAVRIYGECILCDRYLCVIYLAPKYHTCLKWGEEVKYDLAAKKAEQDEITKLIDRFDISALLLRASALHEGIPCSIVQDLHYNTSIRGSVMGGMNFHIKIQFEDGITWLARIRRANATSPPVALRDYILRSEVSTLQFLSGIKVPAPKVKDFNSCESNSVGVRYILMEKLPGRSMRWSLATAEQRRKVTGQLADIYLELFRHPFPLTGSLNHPGSLDIGPFAREYSTEYHDSQMKPMGPFASPKDKLDDGNFYLEHADEKGDQILVDDEFNITGIIDWEWAYTDTKSGAFNSPIVLLPVADFYAGQASIGEDELFFAKCFEDKGYPDLGRIVKNGRLIHLFRFCCGYDLADWEGFLGLFGGLQKCMANMDTFNWNEWKKERLEFYREDKQFRQVLKIYSQERLVLPEAGR